MRKKKKYLPLYYKWMEQGHIDPIGRVNFKMYNGMCGNFIGDELFGLFQPTKEELDLHVEEGYEFSYWAAEINDRDLTWEFGPLRQTIVLFIAAMNGEL